MCGVVVLVVVLCCGFFGGVEVVSIQNWVAKSKSQNFIEKVTAVVVTAVVQMYLQGET